MKPSKSAAREAYEEAGVRGEIRSKSIGSFDYEKRLDDDGAAVPCEVQVFSLLVKRQFRTWPEAEERDHKWFSPAKARIAVKEIGLKALIEDFCARQSTVSPGRVKGRKATETHVKSAGPAVASKLKRRK